MRLLTSKVSDFLSNFDKVHETQNGFKVSSLWKVHIDNHEVLANRGKVREHLPLEHVLFEDFAKCSKRILNDLLII